MTSGGWEPGAPRFWDASVLVWLCCCSFFQDHYKTWYSLLKMANSGFGLLTLPLLMLLLHLHNSAALVPKCCAEQQEFNSTSLQCVSKKPEFVSNNSLAKDHEEPPVSLPSCENSTIAVIPYDPDMERMENYSEICEDVEASSGARVAVICNPCDFDDRLCIRLVLIESFCLAKLIQFTYY